MHTTRKAARQIATDRSAFRRLSDGALIAIAEQLAAERQSAYRLALDELLTRY